MKTHFCSTLRTARSYACMAALILCGLGHVQAQVATCNASTTIANFGIDNDVNANTSSPGTDDWFLSGTFGGTGIGIIGTTAATAQPPLLLSTAAFSTMLQSSGTVADRNISYVQRMSVPSLTVESNMLLLDAFAARDNVSSGGADSTVFAGASAKNEDNPAVWTIGNGGVPMKNDIVDVGGHLRRNLSTNDLWGFAFLTILANTGGEYSDVEFYRTIPSISGSSLVNTGPAASGGHTPFLFSSTATIQDPGDVLASVNYNASSGVASIRVWIKPNNVNGLNQDTTWFNAQPNRPFTFTGDFISATNANGYGYAEIRSKSTATCIVYSTLNSSPTPAGPWGQLSGSSLTYTNTFNTSQFVEIAINFTQLGLDLNNVTGACYNIFGSVLFKTRTSNSWSSELKDFAGPFTFGNFAEVQANAGIDRTLNCTNPTISLLGGSQTPGATYSWTTSNGNIVSGNTNAQPVVNQPGTYILTVVSPTLATCTVTDTVIVSLDMATPTAYAGNDISIDCNTGPAVSINATASSGTTISWTPLSGGNIVSGLNTVNPTVSGAAGYIMTATNSTSGCFAQDTVFVSLHMAPPVINTDNYNHPSCNGGCNGSISVNISSTYNPITYLWSNGSTATSITGLCAGTYTVTATGSNGCTVTKSYTLSAPTAITGSVSPTSIMCYGGATGTITSSVSGGTIPYTYLWNNNATTQNLSNVIAGLYAVTVTDANGCSETYSATLTQPDAPLALTTSSTNILCRNNLTGSVTANVTGGTTPYVYTWNTGATTSAITGVGAGNYTVTVTDANNCTKAVSVTLTQPAQILSGTLNTTNVSCHNGSNGAITSSVSGGTVPYQYTWSNGSAASSISSLTSGPYTLTVTDANGCTIQLTSTVTQPAAALAATFTQTNILCFGNTTGAIDVSVTGGTTPYTYLWNTNATTQDLTNRAAGAYQLTITDQKGCTTSISTILTQPAGALVTSTSSTAVKCFGGSDGVATVSTSGGTTPYTYAWNNGVTSAINAGISNGNYTITVTDANGCTSRRTVNISQPSAALTLTETHLDLSCFSQPAGSINLGVSGGTTPYSYNWSNGFTTQDISGLAASTYSVTVTDDNGCTATKTIQISQPAGELHVATTLDHVNCFSGNDGQIDLNLTLGTPPYGIQWSTGSTAPTISNLTTGFYTASVTDANGCNLEIISFIQQPAAALAVTETITPVYCFGDATGSILLDVTGGTTAYQYQWSNGATTEDITGLTTGVYTITVTDAQACTFTSTYTVSQPAAPLTVTAAVTQPNCVSINDGAIDLTITGGTLPYVILWSSGATSEDISNLAPGNYTVLITDAVNCTTTGTYTIDYTAPLLTISGSATAVLCHGDSTGALTIVTTGGAQPYSYNWSNGATTSNITGIVTGNYTVTVTDIKGCIASWSNNIAEPAASLQTTEQHVAVACHGDASGSIDLTTSNGTPGYTYLWSDGNANEDRLNLLQGTYGVTITDANGCTVTLTTVINQPAAPLSAQGIVTPVLCNSNLTGAIQFTVNGGSAPYLYTWSNGSNTASIQNLAAGQYSVLVTDTNNCSLTDSFQVSEPAAAIAISGTLKQVSCNGINDGTIDIVVTGGTPAYTYSWNNGSTTQNVNGLIAGTYTLTVTDANNCVLTQSFSLTQPLEVLHLTGNVSDANCIYGILGNIIISPSGGTQPYTYSWSNANTSQNLSNVLPGTYFITVTDLNGCTTGQEFNIADKSVLNVEALGNTTICVGNTVTISAIFTQSITAGLQWYYNGSPLIGANSNSFFTPVAGTYTLVASTACGSYTSNPVEVVVRSLNSVMVSSDVIICAGERIQLQAGGGVDYTWSPAYGLSDPASSSPFASPVNTTEYTVTVKDDFGCSARATVTVNVACDTLDIPNGFSPNDDGTNDTFVIDGLSKFPDNMLWIYNRWGNLVYKKSRYDNTWDGRSNVSGIVMGEELPNGTYYYLLDLKSEKPFKGFVVIRR